MNFLKNQKNIDSRYYFKIIIKIYKKCIDKSGPG